MQWVLGELPGGFQLSILSHFWSPLSTSLVVPNTNLGAGEIFRTDFTGDGTVQDPIPGTRGGSFDRGINASKTEYSQDEVPLEKSFIAVLKKWQELCAKTEQQWVFPSPATGRPYHADSIRADYLVPAGVKLGLGRTGFHTFRHTYRAWLDETGAPMGVQQKLMRHAHISTTMDQYGNASAVAKRKANRPIVQRVLRREMNHQLSIQ